MFDFDKITRDFQRLGEARIEPTVRSYIRSLEQILKDLKPTSERDRLKIKIALDNVHGIKKHFRRMEEEKSRMEEKLNLLEEETEGE